MHHAGIAGCDVTITALLTRAHLPFRHLAVEQLTPDMQHPTAVHLCAGHALQEDLVSYAGGRTWYRFVNYLPPPSGFINKLTRNMASNIAQVSSACLEVLVPLNTVGDAAEHGDRSSCAAKVCICPLGTPNRVWTRELALLGRQHALYAPSTRTACQITGLIVAVVRWLTHCHVHGRCCSFCLQDKAPLLVLSGDLGLPAPQLLTRCHACACLLTHCCCCCCVLTACRTRLPSWCCLVVLGCLPPTWSPWS
jgi:hypothetical protein